MKITFEGKILTSITQSEKRKVYDDISKEMAESLKRAIEREFDQSIKMATLLGNRQDQEAIKAIIRSIKVDIISIEPFKFHAYFKDDYAHWYVGQELPDDVADSMQEVMDAGIDEWFREGHPSEVIAEVMNSD